MRVLSTKVLDADILDAAKQCAMDVDCIPMIAIETTARKSILAYSDLDNVVFTSQYAVQSLKKDEVDWLTSSGVTVSAIEGRTKSQLEDLGIAVQLYANTGAELSVLILADESLVQNIHLCSNIALQTIRENLQNHGKVYLPLVSYRNIAQGREIQAKYDWILFFSPSAIDAFLSCNILDTKTKYACIGPTTYNYLMNKNNSIEAYYTEEASQAALLKLIQNKTKT